MQDDEKVHLAAYYLEGNAQIWAHRQRTLHPNPSWVMFKEELILRFGSVPYEDAFGELCKLRQMSTVKEFQGRFECLLSKAGVLCVEQETTCFISGLRELIQADVRAQRPSTLSSAIGLARIYEGDIRRRTNGPITHPSSWLLPRTKHRIPRASPTRQNHLRRSDVSHPTSYRTAELKVFASTVMTAIFRGSLARSFSRSSLRKTKARWVEIHQITPRKRRKDQRYF